MKAQIKDYSKSGQRQVKIDIKDYDTYSLDSTLALIIAPSLKKFKKDYLRTTESNEAFINDLNKAIKAFELISEGGYISSTPNPKIQKGLNAFVKIYTKLWW